MRRLENPFNGVQTMVVDMTKSRAGSIQKKQPGGVHRELNLLLS